MFTLAFRTDNAAFEDGAATETGRILRDLARKIEAGELDGDARDHNGNRIGAFTLDGRNPVDSGCVYAYALTADESASAAHHLRVAADKYGENAEICLADAAPAYKEGLTLQFRRQADEARAFAARLEE